MCSMCVCQREQDEAPAYQLHFYMQPGLIKKYGKGSRAVKSSLLTFSSLHKREREMKTGRRRRPTLSREGGTFITRTIKWHQEQTAKRSS